MRRIHRDRRNQREDVLEVVLAHLGLFGLAEFVVATDPDADLGQLLREIDRQVALLTLEVPDHLVTLRELFERGPTVDRELVDAGAELLLNIANWPARRIAHWVKLLQARAIENQCYVAGVNRVGEDPNAKYVGRSMLIDPQGEIVVDAGEEENVVSADVDFQKVRKWRAEFPALKDARRGVVPVDHIG